MLHRTFYSDLCPQLLSYHNHTDFLSYPLQVLEFLRAADAALHTLLQAEAQALALSRPASHTQSTDKNKTQKVTKGASGMAGPGSTGTQPESGYGTGMFLEPPRVDEELWITVTESIVEILGDYYTL
jgi:hypothetical protein